MPYKKGDLTTKNHLVMAPMTRSRAIGNVPNSLMAEYYGQRTGAGLIIAEGTAPAPEALGYARIPGVFNQQQVEAWKQVTDAVHKGGSKFFVQLMHTGRMGHYDNLPEGAVLVGASDIKASGQIFTDTHGLQDYSQPVALSKKGIEDVINGFVTAAKNAINAGFDGVEIHGANGYLPEQFLNPTVNNRKDEYGGNIENRARLLLQIVASVTKAIGKEKVGIRLSPFSILGDLAPYDVEETHQTYVYIAEALNALEIAYLHIGVNAAIPDKTFQSLRKSYSGTIIICNGLTADTAEKALHKGFADLVGFGRSFLSNPDFVRRIEKEVALNPVDFATLYTPGATGYTDYPVFEKSLIQNAELK